MTSELSNRQDDTTARSERRYIGEREWHPLIGALLWILSWYVFSLCLAVLWEFSAGRQLHLNSVLARGLWLLFAVGLLAPVLFVFELWWALVSHGRRNYDRAFSKVLTIIYTTIVMMILTPYFWVFVWLLNFMWPYLGGLLTEPAEAVPHDGPITWIEWLAVPIGMALVMALIPSTIRQLIINYKEAMRLLGARRAAIGSLLLCLLRLRLPRRDLFLQAPVISWVPWIALSIVLYSMISLPVLNWALPLALTVLMLAKGLDEIAPPIWLFLGTSEYDSFVAFHVLRNCWRKCGVTLLNRSNPEGSAFYFVQRRGLPLKSLFLDPTAPRVWSLRTRSNMWRNSVVLLMDHVLVVIVDVRGDSDVVRDELDWLRERGLMNKAWFLASDGERVSDENMEAIGSHYPQIETSSTRLAGLAALSDAAWSRSGLALADFSRKTG